MTFSSVAFLFYFLPAFLAVYYLIPRKLEHATQMRNLWLLLASLVFYAWGAPRFIFILVTSTIIDFFLVRRMSVSQGVTRKRWLIASLVMNLGLLVVFKYADFFTATAMGIAGKEWSGWGLALPIGISFYTFQTLTYALDVYRRDEAPLERLADYLVYILSFPQMIAGPIVRFGKVAREIRQRESTGEDRLQGLYRFSIGLAKKMLIANPLGLVAAGVFDTSFSGTSQSAAWMALVAYHFQIYYDFSGYSDMAIGLGRMMGFRFPENFRSPYVSRTITEFWQRWHITLGTFMRDYLYIPLGGNRSRTASRRYFNLVVVFFASGLWHGAAWNFILWGGAHGALILLERVALMAWIDKRPRIIGMLYMHFSLLLTWVLFRIEDLDVIATAFKTLFAGRPPACDWHRALTDGDWVLIAVAAFFAYFSAFNIGERIERGLFERPVLSRQQHMFMLPMATVLLLLGSIEVLGTDFNPFIYFRF